MNYVRHKGKYVYLASLDTEKDNEKYLEFSKMEGKTLEESKEALNKLNIDNYLGIFENDTNELIGTIGLSSIIQTNRRANMNLDLLDTLDPDKKKKYGSEALQLLLDYAYGTLNLHSILAEVPEYNKELLSTYKDKDNIFSYIGTRRFSSKNDEDLYGTILFDANPNNKEKNILIPHQEVLKVGNEKVDTKIMQDSIYSDIGAKNEISLVKPQLIGEFSKLDIDNIGRALNNPKLAANMGEYKFVYNDYRVNKKAKSVDYLICNDNNIIIGFADRLHVDNNNLATDVEMILFNKTYRGKGYGIEAMNLYLNELRKAGYVSIGGVVFDFNEHSNRYTSNHIGGNLYATRKESYFANGKLNDMNYYDLQMDESIKEVSKKLGGK